MMYILDKDGALYWFNQYHRIGFEWEFTLYRNDTWYAVLANENDTLDAFVNPFVGIDKTGPSISLNLEANEIISGSKDIEITISDDHAPISSFQIYIDSELKGNHSELNMGNLGFKGITHMYEWESYEFVDGYHNITVVSYDASFNKGLFQVNVVSSNHFVTNVIIPIIGVVSVASVVILIMIHRNRTSTSSEIKWASN
jgi:hypothetical protein